MSLQRSDAHDAELIEQTSQGSADAHRELFESYFARVFNFVKRRISDEALAEEIVADVFFELWRRAGEFRGDARVSTWIFGIANFKCLAAARVDLSGSDRSSIHQFCRRS